MSGLIILNATPLQVLKITGDQAPIEIWAATTAPTAGCPACGQPSTRVKSHYWRSPGDLPWRSWPVRWHLWVRRFVCRNPACRQGIFCERLPSVAPYQRWTDAARTTMVRWTRLASASEVARRLRAEGLAVSRQTLNRWIQAWPLPDPPPPRVVGIDEWARCKGRTYATILVDHERGAILEVLPDTRGETVAAWLQEHPTIAVITRDRDAAFARAIVDGAPQAQQVADRWHLLQNLGKTVERFFQRHREVLATSASERAPASETATSSDAAPPPDVPDASTPPLREATRQRQWWQAIHERLARGEPVAAVARALHLDRHTVQRYARLPEPPTPAVAGRHRRPRLDRWAAVLETAWAAGYQTTQALFEAVRAQGYDGGRTTVHRWLVERRGSRRRTRAASAGPAGAPPLRPRQWVAWCLQPWTALPRSATQRLTARLQDPAVRHVWTLTRHFCVLVTHHREGALTGWLHQAETSGIPEFMAFARNLRADEAAVRAAIREPWSQGRTEGFNCRVKRTLRLTYGRAGFRLLRARLLAAGDV